MKGKSLYKDFIIVITAAILFLALIVFVHIATGSTVLSEHSNHDSYSLQAMAWRNGRIALDQNYPWLELAVLNDSYFSEHSMDDPESYKEYFYDEDNKFIEHEDNEYYVSFPPFPAVPMLLFSFIFDLETPNNLICALYSVGAFVFAILIGRRLKFSYMYSIVGAAFVTIASGAFFLVANQFPGSVWFHAQLLSLFLTTASFYFILGKRDRDYYIAFILLGFAVGCRPFQILYYFYFAYIVFKKYNYKFFKTIKFYIPAAAIGGLYMLYNYIRFGNVIEFGHNYLPEFMLAPEGQFSLYYITVNYKTMFLELPKITNDQVHFSIFGFACWSTNVFFIVCILALILKVINYINSKFIKKREVVNNNKINVEISLLLVLVVIHFILILMHKSLGMVQFGSRYTVDILPAALILTGLTYKALINSKIYVLNSVFKFVSVICLISGVIINVSAGYKYLIDSTFIFQVSSFRLYFIILLILIMAFIVYQVLISVKMKRLLRDKSSVENCSENIESE